MQIFKQFVSKLPNRWQIELKRLHYARQIKKTVLSQMNRNTKYSIVLLILEIGLLMSGLMLAIIQRNFQNLSDHREELLLWNPYQ